MHSHGHSGRRRSISGRKVVGATPIALVWLGGLICLFPLAWTLLSSVRPGVSFLTRPFVVNPREWTLTNYHTALADGTIMTGFKNTAIQVVIILTTTLFFCPLAGYGFAKFRFPGKRFLFGLMMLTLFFVPITQYIPLLLEMNALGWINTYQALVMPLAISSLGIFWMHGTIASIPDELLDAARVDGCGRFSVWWRIIMPVIRPALVSLTVITFLAAYNDYFWPLLILVNQDTQTVQIALGVLVSNLQNAETATSGAWGAILATCSLVFLPTVVIFLAVQRQFIRGMLEGSLKE